MFCWQLLLFILLSINIFFAVRAVARFGARSVIITLQALDVTVHFVPDRLDRSTDPFVIVAFDHGRAVFQKVINSSGLEGHIEHMGIDLIVLDG